MQTSQNLLSLVIPCYNQPRRLAACLQSVNEQTFRDVDLVLIDDNSQDSYAGVLEQFKSLRPRYVCNPRNLGALPNMLYALNYPCGSKYKMVFHEDDLMHPQMLELGIRAMEKEPDAVFCGAAMRTFEETPDPSLQARRFDGGYERYDQVADLVRSLMRGSALAFGSVLYRSSAVENAAADLDRFSVLADRPLLCELAKRGSSLLIRHPLLFYRRHGPDDARGRGLTDKHLIELFRYYRACLPPRWDYADEKLFYSFTTNNLLDSYPRLNAESRPGLKAFVAAGCQAGIFRARSLDAKGVKAAFRCLWSQVSPS